MRDLCKYKKETYIFDKEFGPIYRIRDKQTNQKFQAEILRHKIKNSKTSELFSFSREGKLLSKLNHPSIQKFFEYSSVDFEQKAKPLIITEYTSRGTLKSILNRPSSFLKLDDTKKLIILYGIAKGMSFLHSNGIIHCCLNPNSVLINDKYQPKISNFMMSRHININSNNEDKELEHPEEYIEWETGMYQRPSCIAPEMIHNNFSETNHTNKIDVYSYSMLIYEMITGQEPFYDNKDIYEIYFRVTRSERPSLNINTDSRNNIKEEELKDEKIKETEEQEEGKEQYKYSAYLKLMKRCWSQNCEERPTFEGIVEELKQNAEFITSDVDRSEYFKYITYIDECPVSFSETKKKSRILMQFKTRKKEITQKNSLINQLIQVTF